MSHAAGENWRNRASAEETVTSGDIAAEIASAERLQPEYWADTNPMTIRL